MNANPVIHVVDETITPNEAAARIIRWLSETQPGNTRICVIPGRQSVEHIGLVIAVLIQAWSLVHKTPLSFLAAEGGDIAVSPTPLPKKGGGS